MNEMRSNNDYFLNGRVKPPIVLRSETEMLIAQNAHNLVWEKYRREWDAQERELNALKKEKEEASERYAELRRQRDALNQKAGSEINESIIFEVREHRDARSGRSVCELADIVEALIKQVKALTNAVDEAQGAADDAQSAADDAQGIAEEAMEKAEEAMEKAEEAMEKAEEALDKAEEALDKAEEALANIPDDEEDS
jgi:methyl-accepting chemotaxis protein